MKRPQLFNINFVTCSENLNLSHISVDSSSVTIFTTYFYGGHGKELDIGFSFHVRVTSGQFTTIHIVAFAKSKYSPVILLNLNITLV